MKITRGIQEETSDMAEADYALYQDMIKSVKRYGGYNLMGGTCYGSDDPAALRDPFPGKDHHPNVTFRVALFVK